MRWQIHLNHFNKDSVVKDDGDYDDINQQNTTQKFENISDLCSLSHISQ